MRTLYRASRVHTLSYPAVGEWVLVDGRPVQRVGTGEPPGGGGGGGGGGSREALVRDEPTRTRGRGAAAAGGRPGRVPWADDDPRDVDAPGTRRARPGGPARPSLAAPARRREPRPP